MLRFSTNPPLKLSMKFFTTNQIYVLIEFVVQNLMIMTIFCVKKSGGNMIKFLNCSKWSTLYLWEKNQHLQSGCNKDTKKDD